MLRGKWLKANEVHTEPRCVKGMQTDKRISTKAFHSNYMKANPGYNNEEPI